MDNQVTGSFGVGRLVAYLAAREWLGLPFICYLEPSFGGLFGAPFGFLGCELSSKLSFLSGICTGADLKAPETVSGEFTSNGTLCRGLSPNLTAV